MRTIICSLLIFFTTPIYANQDTYPFADKQIAKRFQTLTHNVRCVVCQNQSLADSDAQLANDLRDKIYRMMLEKKSDREIINFLTSRYGDFILFQPRFNKATMTLWFFPFFALICGIFFLRRLYKPAQTK